MKRTIKGRLEKSFRPEMKGRLEELFSAEMTLRRVYLHLQQSKPVDIAAQMLVVIRYEEITK